LTDQPDIFIGAVRIQEPVIAITSFVVTTFAFVGYYKTRNAKRNSSIHLYRMFILFSGISCLLSGFFGHAFSYNFGVGGKFSTWFTSMIAVSFAEQAALIRVRSYIGKNTFKFLSIFNIVQVIVFIAITIFKPQFVFVEIHTAIGLLLIVCSMEIFIYTKVKSRISLNIIAGIGMLIFAVLFHIFKISATNWFTYFDFGHIFMSLCLMFFTLSILWYHETEVRTV